MFASHSFAPHSVVPHAFVAARRPDTRLPSSHERRHPVDLAVGSVARTITTLLVIAIWLAAAPTWGQEELGPNPAETGVTTPADGADLAPDTTGLEVGGNLNLLNLLVQGGWFMVPLLGLSVFVVAITIERGIALRRSNVLPPALLRDLGELGRNGAAFDPRQAYRLCQTYPSSGSRVLQAMLTKVGRPQSEVEHTVAETSQREAEKLHNNVRWLNMTAQVAPLIGLLGTVWGMIQAFYDTTQLDPGQNKSEALAEGIYTALVTTLVGLIVAIPAAIAAHYFESRIMSLFHRVDEMAFNLFPQIERFEGRVRFNRQED